MASAPSDRSASGRGRGGAIRLAVALVAVGCQTGLEPSPATAPATRHDGLEPRVAALIERLAVKGERALARQELAALGQDATPALLAHMGDERTAVRWELANLQGEWVDERARPSLLEYVLLDEDPHVRWRALWALGRYPDPEPSLETLRRALGSEEESVRWNGAVGLSMFGADDGLEILHRGVRQAHPWRRWEAINALGRVHDERTARLLGPVLLSPDLRDRNEAVLSLGKIGGEDSVILLMGALGDEAPDVRWRACLALARVGNLRAVPALRALLERERSQQVILHAERAIARLEEAE